MRSWVQEKLSDMLRMAGFFVPPGCPPPPSARAPRNTGAVVVRNSPHLVLTAAGEVWYIPHIAHETTGEAAMPRLTEGELEIMRILWEHGELKPAEIHAHFPRNIKNASLRSYLAILLDKDHVVRRRVGKAYFYRAKTRRESTFRAMLRELTRVCCDGSMENLLCQLIRTQKLSATDLLELKRVSAEGRRPPNPSREEKKR